MRWKCYWRHYCDWWRFTNSSHWSNFQCWQPGILQTDIRRCFDAGEGKVLDYSCVKGPSIIYQYVCSHTSNSDAMSSTCCIWRQVIFFWRWVCIPIFLESSSSAMEFHFQVELLLVSPFQVLHVLLSWSLQRYLSIVEPSIFGARNRKAKNSNYSFVTMLTQPGVECMGRFLMKFMVIGQSSTLELMSAMSTIVKENDSTPTEAIPRVTIGQAMPSPLRGAGSDPYVTLSIGSDGLHMFHCHSNEYFIANA